MSLRCKIIMASGPLPPEVSGASRVVMEFCEGFEKDGIDYEVIGYGDTSTERIHAVPRGILRHFLYVKKLKSLRDQRPTILFAQDLLSSGLPTAIAKQRDDVFVLRLGGDFLYEKQVARGARLTLSQFYQGGHSLKEKLYMWIFRFILNKADKIIFNSDFQRDLYQKYYHVDKDKTSVIANTTITSVGILTKESTQRFVYVGRLSPIKNVPMILEAFKGIQNKALELEIIGDGPEMDRCRALVGGDNRIRFSGGLDHTKVIEKIATARGVIMASLTEIQPHVIWEAVSVGTPFIIPRETGLPMNIIESGLAVDPFSADDIREKILMLTDDNIRQSLIDKLSHITPSPVSHYQAVMKVIEPLCM